MSKSKHLPPVEEESNDTFAFIAGYTPAGFPYGTTWAELGIDPDLPIEEKRQLYDAATAGEQLLNVDYNGPHVKTSNEDLMVNVWLRIGTSDIHQTGRANHAGLKT